MTAATASRINSPKRPSHEVLSVMLGSLHTASSTTPHYQAWQMIRAAQVATAV
eukprot:CAMPEP_0115585580 /NCGR_PEP_ID=MMETSP0272-20121206/7267_1 /TAXON_ID=71861 /ORGANISM="Scrippsiella trochoidea, Strain CCMP3099" /LENGTH=52 /DNA_ID=CAMNT_0003020639 /DNA_START=134 /DNA_END=288 /DNA_ORIENTATION=-